MTSDKSVRPLDHIGSTFFKLGKGLVDSTVEVVRAIRKGQIPDKRFCLFTVVVCVIFRFQLDILLLKSLGLHQFVTKGGLRNFLSVSIALSPWVLWGFLQNKLRRSLNEKLKFVFESIRATTGIGLTPEYVFDEPLDSNSRKLRIWANGLSIDVLRSNKNKLEDGLGLSISKIAWADDFKKMMDVVYTFGALPDFYVPEKLFRFKNFQFPIGQTSTGEILTSLLDIPHFLIGGETGTGKSTFIRMVIEVLLMNNEDIEIYFFDFKGGIEAQSIFEDARFHIVTDYAEAFRVITEINTTLDERGRNLAGVARNIDVYNKKQKSKEKRLKRILVVIDEVSEISPRFKMPYKNEMTSISNGINRIARLGRALGIHLMVGTQKPDAKNLDPTIKANLGGILCFAMTHPSQSMVVLGDGRASDLNAEIRGRAIWKHGSFSVEVQTPFLDDSEIAEARGQINSYWGNFSKNQEPHKPEGVGSTEKAAKMKLLGLEAPDQSGGFHEKKS